MKNTKNGSLFPRKGGIAMVTYGELFQFALVIIGVVGVCYQIFEPLLSLVIMGFFWQDIFL